MSTKPKVYLAKSNRANPELVSRVRQTLSKYDIEIVEFKGGQFSHKPMLECERLVVVPDLSDEENIVIGKGLYEQIERFGSSKGFEYVLTITSDNMLIKELDDIDIIDYEDYVEYALLHFQSSWGSEYLKDVLDEIGYNPKSSNTLKTSGKSNYYMLIGKKV